MIIVSVTEERQALDLLLWRHFGRKGQDLLDQTFALNPGLAEMGYFLPVETMITFPDLSKEISIKQIDLFG